MIFVICIWISLLIIYISPPSQQRNIAWCRTRLPLDKSCSHSYKIFSFEKYIFRYSFRLVEMRVSRPLAAVSLLVVYVYFLAKQLLPLGNLVQSSPQTDLHLNPTNMTLINLDQFEFLANKDQCGNSPITLLILVHSAPGNWMVREAIRNSWGRYHLL